MARFRRRRKATSLLIFTLALIYVVLTRSGWLDKIGQTAQQSNPGLYTINHYVDGDTIAVNMNGSVETIRFIGVDTPETHKPNTPVQCYGPEAAAHTKTTISQFGKVRLEADPLDTNRDVYGRLLRYVYLPDGTLLNEQLIKQGYGFAYLSFPFSQKAQSPKMSRWPKRPKPASGPPAIQPSINTAVTSQTRLAIDGLKTQKRYHK